MKFHRSTLDTRKAKVSQKQSDRDTYPELWKVLQGSGDTGRTYDGHPSFHRELFNSRSTILNNRTGTTSCPNLANDMKNDIFTTYARCKLSVDLDSHVLASLRDEGLCREHVLDF